MAAESTSAIEKVSGHKLFYTKSGHFCTLILAPTLELKIGKSSENM
jgi:hypothetical protein